MTIAYTLGAGLAAAALAYGLNWLVLRHIGRGALWMVVPALEETLKSLAASVLNASLPGAHLVFGLVEAGHELAAGRPSPIAASLALITHGVFGLLTWLLVPRGGLGPAIVAATTLHALYNMAVVRPRHGSPGRPHPAGEGAH